MRKVRQAWSWKREVLGVAIAVACVWLLVGFPSIFFGVAYLFVVMLPGFALLQATVPDAFDLTERLILAPIVGIAFTTVVAVYLSFVGIPITRLTVVLMVLLVSLPLFAYAWQCLAS
jgi:uncharacterized membrane protein